MPSEDIVAYLKRCFFTRAFFHRDPLRHRIAAFTACREKAFSVRELLILLLPTRLMSVKKALLERYYVYMRRKSRAETERYAPNNGAFNLFGQSFSYPDQSEAVVLIDQIISSDQYQARQFIKKDTIVIDAGANIGVFAIFAAALAPAGRVFAFEPAKKTFDLLKRNTAPYAQIVCLSSALGVERSRKNILVREGTSAENIMEDSPMFDRGGNSKGVWEKVDMTTIDSFVSEKGLPRVDFIKIDSEGYEANILRGAEKTIRIFEPVIAMSAYHNRGDKEELPRILKKIDDKYECKLYTDCEQDLVCRVPSRASL